MTSSMTTAARVGKSRYLRILLPICLTFFVVAIDRSNVSVAVPTIATDFQISTAVIGIVLSAFYWGYVPVQIPGALFGQYVSAKWLITGALCLWAVGTVLSGLTTGLPELIAARIIVGLGEGAAVPTLLVLIRRWFPVEERGRATSAFFIFGQAGNLIGTAVTGLLIAATSWRVTFFLEAIPSIIVAVVVAVCVADDPEKDKRLSAGERQMLQESRIRESKESGVSESAKWTTVIKNPLLWGFVIIWVMSSAGSYGLQSWVPTVVKEATNAGIGNVGLLSAIPYLCSIVLLLVVGWSSDRVRRRAPFIIVGFILAGLAIYLGPALANPAGRLTVIFLGVACNASITGIIIAWLEDLTPRSHAGVAIGVLQFIGQMAGIGTPLAVGLLAGNGPVSDALWVIGLALFVGAFISLLIMFGARRQARRAASVQLAVGTVAEETA